ncbi:MAG TPA: glycosyltransferase family 4 protein [Micropepsaceae bacterium]|nr:glycosyltransferase family 4 protein [Micropepsaceae bacterium]
MVELKVLMLSHYFERHRGGIEIVANALARQLMLSGFAVRWLATGNAGGTEDWRRSVAASNICETLLKFPYPLLYPSAWHAVWTEAKAADVVVMHDAMYMTSIVGWLAARAHRKPVIVVQHIGAVPYRNLILRFLMTLGNRLITFPILRRVDRIVFISQTTAKFFHAIRLQCVPTVIFNGVDTQVFRPASGGKEFAEARAGLGLPPDATVALFVGRFVEKKGLAVLEQMARDHPSIFFVFAGWGAIDPAGWQLPNVRVYRSLSGASLAPLYRASDVVLLPSVGEGFPLVIQEAMACGLPVVCGTDTAQADPAATCFLSGVSVDLNKPDLTARLFAQEVLRLLRAPSSGNDQQARWKFAREHYSWNTTATAYARLLRGCLEQAAGEIATCQIVGP